MSAVLQYLVIACAVALPVGLAWHWWFPYDWTGRRKSIKLNSRRNNWDDD